MSKVLDETSLLLDSIVEGLFDKGGENIVTLDMRKLDNTVCDYFVVCHAQSGTQVDSLAESVVHTTRTRAGEKPFHKEGLDNCFWVLLDYGNIVVHIFMEEYRKFYNLEGLWADAELEVIVDKKALN